MDTEDNNLRKHMEIGEDGTVCFPAGYVHLPKVDAEYLKQLCAEQLVTRRDRNGFPVREWQKVRERNEALDGYLPAPPRPPPGSTVSTSATGASSNDSWGSDQSHRNGNGRPKSPGRTSPAWRNDHARGG